MSGPTRREQISAMRADARTAHERRLYRRAAAGILAEIVAAPLAGGWTLWIIVGILHRDWWHAVPAMRFGTAWSVVFLLLAGIEAIVYGSRLLKDWVRKA